MEVIDIYPFQFCNAVNLNFVRSTIFKFQILNLTFTEYLGGYAYVTFLLINEKYIYLLNVFSKSLNSCS